MKKEALSGWAGKSTPKASKSGGFNAIDKAISGTHGPGNGWTDGGSSKAHDASNASSMAKGLSQRNEHAKAADAHAKAAALHDQAAKDTMKSGRKDLATVHENAAESHRIHSEEHATLAKSATAKKAVYAQAAKKAEIATRDANDASSRASRPITQSGMQSGISTNHGSAMYAHNRAATAHREAGKAAAAVGLHADAAQHGFQADHHAGKAQSHNAAINAHDARNAKMMAGSGGDDIPRDDQGRFAPK